MKCCRRYVSQTFAINTFRFAIFSSKKPFLTRVFIHRKFFNHLVNIFVKKLLIFWIFQNKNTKMLTNFITKTFYYMTYSSFPGLIGTLFNQSESSKLKKMILIYIHLDCQLGFVKCHQRWPKYESVCLWSWLLTSIFCIILVPAMFSHSHIHQGFIGTHQPSWFSINNAKFKRKYCEQAVQMYLCQLMHQVCQWQVATSLNFNGWLSSHTPDITIYFGITKTMTTNGTAMHVCMRESL